MEASREEAVALIRAQVRATAEVVKAVNSGRGFVSKRKNRDEENAASRIFRALTGDWPTSVELSHIIE